MKLIWYNHRKNRCRNTTSFYYSLDILWLFEINNNMHHTTNRSPLKALLLLSTLLIIAQPKCVNST